MWRVLGTAPVKRGKKRVAPSALQTIVLRGSASPVSDTSHGKLREDPPERRIHARRAARADVALPHHGVARRAQSSRIRTPPSPAADAAILLASQYEAAAMLDPQLGHGR